MCGKFQRKLCGASKAFITQSKTVHACTEEQSLTWYSVLQQDNRVNNNRDDTLQPL
jgi:alkylated DNA nucleotide flippase Atl1